MTEAETVEWLVYALENEHPFVHVRFGDGDVMFATGTGSKITGDGEEFSEELSGNLRLAWRSLAAPKNLVLGDLRTYAVSDGVEHEWDILLAELRANRTEPFTFCHMEALRVGFGHALPFYRAVARDPRPKCFVGPERLRPVSALLGCAHLTIPLHVSYEWEHVTRTIVDVIWQKYELALFAAGRGGKIMQSLLGLMHPTLTQIDVGSGLDLLIEDGVRRGTDIGIDREKIVREYREAGLCP